MKINMTQRGVQLSANDLQQFEKEIGYELPVFYRNFLLEFNGGEPFPYHFNVPTWKYKASLVQDLKGIDDNQIGWDLRKINHWKSDILPKGFIIIGSDPGGNSILLSLDGETSGKIFFWDHEMQPDNRLESLDTYKNIHPLAESFETFIKNLKPEEEMDWFE